MGEAVRNGASMRSAAHWFEVSLPTVQRWVSRSQGFELEKVDWTDHASITHRLVRCEVNLDTQKIFFFALRRLDPNTHALLNQIPYELKQKWLSRRH